MLVESGVYEGVFDVRNDTYVEKLIDVSQSTKLNVMLVADDASW